MSPPSRIQRRRTRGWRLPENAVIVDRTSRYGNPFVVEGTIVIAPDARAWQLGSPGAARRFATEQHRLWLAGEGPDTYTVGRRTYDRRRVLASLPQLRGQDLACPCDVPSPGEPDYCHGQNLLAAANSPVEVTR